MNEIFEPVIRKLTQEIAQRLPDIPGDLKKAHSFPAAGNGATAGTPSAGDGIGIAAGPLGLVASKVPKAAKALISFFTGPKIPTDKND